MSKIRENEISLEKTFYEKLNIEIEELKDENSILLINYEQIDNLKIQITEMAKIQDKIEQEKTELLRNTKQKDYDFLNLKEDFKELQETFDNKNQEFDHLKEDFTTKNQQNINSIQLENLSLKSEYEILKTLQISNEQELNNQILILKVTNDDLNLILTKERNSFELTIKESDKTQNEIIQSLSHQLNVQKHEFDQLKIYMENNEKETEFDLEHELLKKTINDLTIEKESLLDNYKKSESEKDLLIDELSKNESEKQSLLDELKINSEQKGNIY